MDHPAINPRIWEVEGSRMWIAVNPGIARSYLIKKTILKGIYRKLMYIQMRE